MNNGAVLDVNPVAHPNVVYIAPDNCIEPNTALISHNNIPHNDRVLRDKTLFSEYRGFAPDFLYDRHASLLFYLKV